MRGYEAKPGLLQREPRKLFAPQLLSRVATTEQQRQRFARVARELLEHDGSQRRDARAGSDQQRRRIGLPHQCTVRAADRYDITQLELEQSGRGRAARHGNFEATWPTARER